MQPLPAPAVGGLEGRVRESGERRRRRRVAFDGWVEITAPASRHRARGVDLSAGGLGVAFRHAPPAELTSVVSEFALPGLSLPLAVEARVAWNDPGSARMGLRFVGVDPGIAELLARYTDGRL